MGFPMAGNLSLNSEAQIYVFNRTQSVSSRWIKKYQGTQVTSFNDLSIKFDGVITCLKDDASIKSTILQSGLLKLIKTKGFIVDHSTTSLALVDCISNHPNLHLKKILSSLVETV